MKEESYHNQDSIRRVVENNFRLVCHKDEKQHRGPTIKALKLHRCYFPGLLNKTRVQNKAISFQMIWFHKEAALKPNQGSPHRCNTVD